jgi:phospholipid/cholesterol/gamma-HCH transport system ATP-binding protein
VISRLREEMGLGAVLVTHLINDVYSVADRVLIIYQGKLIYDDVPDMMQHSTHPFVSAFLTHEDEDELL